MFDPTGMKKVTTAKGEDVWVEDDSTPEFEASVIAGPKPPTPGDGGVNCECGKRHYNVAIEVGAPDSTATFLCGRPARKPLPNE